MLYFFINIPYNEIIQFENRLPKGSYCLFQVQSSTSRYYGIMKKEAYQILKEYLPKESLANIELLDKKIFQLFFLQNISDNISYFGNRRLMVHLSDEA